MIRSLLMAAGFLVVTISLLLLQPSAPRSTQDDFSGAPVTRSESGIAEAVAVPQAEPSREAFETQVVEVQDAGTAVSVQASIVQDTPVNGADPVQDRVSMMTQNILQELRNSQAATSVTPIAPTGVAARLASAAQANAGPSELNNMLREAVAQGEVTADTAFVTTTGDVDYLALLTKYLPEQALRSVTPISQDFLYRVQPGDSLAGLAMTFYGDARQYNQITAANVGVITPDQPLAMGILLKIPAL